MVEPLSWIGIITSIFCGAMIGLERQYYGKPAGIRTSALICISVYTFVALSKAVIAEAGVSADASRVLGQVVTGVGFLGGGVILSKEGDVYGVTSASTIWAIAAIGAVIGFSYYGLGVVLTAVVIFILTGVNVIERSFKALRRGVHQLPIFKD